MRQPCRNLIGKDTLLEFLATLQRATVLFARLRPAHMATTVGTPVVGLYAATNPGRSGPYFSRRWCVDRYDRAATRFRIAPPQSAAWTEKIELPGVMDLIEIDDAVEKLDELMAAGAPRTPTSDCTRALRKSRWRQEGGCAIMRAPAGSYPIRRGSHRDGRTQREAIQPNAQHQYEVTPGRPAAVAARCPACTCGIHTRACSCRSSRPAGRNARTAARSTR